MAAKEKVRCDPATRDRWNDLVTLFGKNGACAGCWCMWFRLKRSIWEKQRGEQNRKALKKMIDSGTVPGMIAYVDDQPAGWCCIGPREDFVALENSRILKRIDDRPVWSMVCFFVSRTFRKRGMTKKLIDAAVQYASGQGAQMIEAYPVEPKKESIPDLYGYHGFSSVFRKAGFTEILRRSETRPIMRKIISKE